MKNKNWRRMAKNLLYNYPANTRLLKQQEYDLILGRSQTRDNRWRRGGLSDPTAMSVLKLDNAAQQSLAQETAAVEKLLAYLNTARRIDKKKTALLQMVYFRTGYSLLSASVRLEISDRTAKRWNNELLEFIAKERSWLD